MKALLIHQEDSNHPLVLGFQAKGLPPVVDPYLPQGKALLLLEGVIGILDLQTGGLTLGDDYYYRMEKESKEWIGSLKL
jgi:hypothetical protein